MAEANTSLGLAIALLPGFVGYVFFQLILEKTIEDTFYKFSITVLIAAISSPVASFILHQFNIAETQIDVAKEDLANSLGISFFVRSVISILTGIILGVICNSKYASKLAIRFGMTSKSGHSALICAVLDEYPDAFFRFRFKDGGYIVGHPKFYSLDGTERSLMLEKVAIRKKRPDGGGPVPKQALATGPGVIIFDFDDVQYVEVL